MPIPSAVTLRVLTIDEWPIFRELRLEALREAPYAFGSTLDDWQGDGDTEQRWRQRLTDVPFNAVAYLRDTPVGMASGTQPNADRDLAYARHYPAVTWRRSFSRDVQAVGFPQRRGLGIGQAVVDAHADVARRGQGVADALVDAVVRWAREQNIDNVSLAVRESNDRARAFYRRQGFVDQGRIDVAPGMPPERRMLKQ